MPSFFCVKLRLQKEFWVRKEIDFGKINRIALLSLLEEIGMMTGLQLLRPYWWIVMG